jgi:hypothetical protein
MRNDGYWHAHTGYWVCLHKNTCQASYADDELAVAYQTELLEDVTTDKDIHEPLDNIGVRGSVVDDICVHDQEDDEHSNLHIVLIPSWQGEHEE